jgi:lipopolysaccharide export LptBFGC system permease protein LptF
MVEKLNRIGICLIILLSIFTIGLILISPTQGNNNSNNLYENYTSTYQTIVITNNITNYEKNNIATSNNLDNVNKSEIIYIKSNGKYIPIQTDKASLYNQVYSYNNGEYVLIKENGTYKIYN